MTVLARPAPAVSIWVSFARLLATVLAAVLFAAGWTAGAVVSAFSWCAAAVRVGFDDAYRSGGRT